MPLHNVTDSDAYDANIQMPADGDPADASDFESSTVRPIANRFRWLKTRLDLLLVWLDGGTITPAGAVDFDQSLGVGGDLGVGANLDVGGWMRGRRRVRADFPTADETYDGTSPIDVVYVERPALAAGTTTITISDTGFGNGDTITVCVVGASSGKNVVIDTPSGGTLALGDTDSVRYTFMRRASNNWPIING